MTRGVRILIGSTLLVLLLAAGGLWLAADRLLDEVARPWLTAQAAAALDAEVEIERLTYADGRLLLTGLSLTRPKELQLDVAAIDVKFSWPGLLQRRIDELVVREPRLTWTAPAQEITGEPTPWPQTPPLAIDAWSIENGRIELAWGARKILFDQLAAEGGLDQQFPFALSALCGAAPATPLQLVGHARWQDGPAITLDELSWNNSNLLTQPVTLAPGPDQALGAQLSLARLDDAELGRLFTSLGEPLPWPAELHWQLTSPTLDLRLRDNRLEASLKTAAGLLQTAEQNWPWLDMALTLQGDAQQLELAGHIGMAGATTLNLTGSWANQRLLGDWSVAAADPVALLQSIGMTMPATAFAPSDLQVQGQIEAGLDAARISKTHLLIRLGELGTLAGEVRGEWRDQQLSLGIDRLTVAANDGTRLAEGALSLAGAPAGADWHGEWSLRVADVAKLAGQGGFPLPEGLADLQELSVEGKLRYQDNRLSLPGIDLAGKVSGAGLSGQLHGQLELQTAPDIDLAVVLKSITLDALEYQAEDGMAGLTGGKLNLLGRLELAGEHLRFDLSGQVAAAEALVDSWYGSLQELPANFAVKGSWSSDRQRLELTTADVDLADLVRGHVTGSYADGATNLSGQVEIPQMKGAFQKTLQTLAGELLPDIKQVTLDGRLMFDGAVRYRPGNWDIDLAMLPTDVTLAWGQEARVEGLHGRLPIHLRQGPPTANDPTEQATLQWSRLQGSLFDSGPGRLELQTFANRWQLRQPLTLAVAGGTLQMTALQLDLPELVPHLKASFEVQNVDLGQMTSSLGWPEMSGRLNARLQEARIAEDEISTVGDAAMHVFGGDFTINNMRVEAPFSRFPTYHADVDFTGIDLYQLTNTFEFGEMNGIANGYIHNLRLFDGTPSALQAKLETRPEGTRNISVKAIRNLNTLSMGGLSAALSQGIYQFIDFYRYRKIGIVCRLQNDLFHLEGTAREGSDQYLIYGGLLPPRIDVVVSSPTISFKEMVGRLKRIERTDR